MHKLYQKPVTTASPDVKTAPPKISKSALSFINVIVGPYILMLFGLAKFILHGEKYLFDAFSESLSGKNRCIIAFRHPDGREPQLLGWLFLFRLRQLAAKKGIRFAKKPHVVFVYGYEVVRWGGAAARMIMPKIGAIPVHHAKLDSKGMAGIYDSICNGIYPLALAPEGQVSYSTGTVPRLESGVIRIGFKAANRLSGVNCHVKILPLSIHFRYGKRGKAAMEKLLGKTEKICGFSGNDCGVFSFEERLNRCRNFILETNEKRYNIKTNNNLSFEERNKIAVNAALDKAERMLGINNGHTEEFSEEFPKEFPKERDFFSRLYKVRHICWDRIFLPDTDNFDNIPALKRSVMDLEAGEAWHIARHQELADFGWYFCGPLPGKDSPLHEKAEYVQNLWDYANRTMGGAFSRRINIPPDKVIIKAAPLIDLSERLSMYKENRKGAIEITKNDLEKAYLDCIKEVNKAY